MSIAKSMSRAASLLLAVTFIFTNTAYSLDRTLRVPLQLETLERQKLVQNSVKTAKLNTKSVTAQSQGFATLDNVDVANKIVLVRPDINAPVENGHIKNPDKPHKRIIAAAKTLKELAEKNAKVVVIFHQGRMNDPDFMDIPDEHAAQLEKLAGRPVKFVNDLFGAKAAEAIKSLQAGEILVLKPVRAQDSSTGKELEKNPLFVSTLESLVDLFVLDGFSVAHRDSPSVTGFKNTPTIAGRLMEAEINGARQLLNPSKPHLVVVGGGKIAEKITEFESALTSGRADKILVGGRLANLALVAKQFSYRNPSTWDETPDSEIFKLAVATLGEATANDLQKSGEFKELKRVAKLIIENRDKIELPSDMASVIERGPGAREIKEVKFINGRVPEGFNLLLSGTGSETNKRYAEIASRKDNPFASAFVVGPLGDTRYDELVPGTRQVLEAVALIPFWSTGGGDTEALVTNLGLEPTYTSLAGGALAEFKAGKQLPGVALLTVNQPAIMAAAKRATEAVRISVIGGNWKMEITSEEEAETLLRKIIEEMKTIDVTGVEVVIGVPIAFLGHLSKVLRDLEAKKEISKGAVKIAAQNVAGVEKGAQTGRTSILQIKNLGVAYVIIGHSEQRRDEKDELVSAENRAINKKVKLAIEQNLIPVICVGESESERNAGKTNEIVLDMLTQALDGLTPEQVADSIVAYEPVWAIGKGKTAATPQQAEEVLKFIRRLMLDMFDEDTASKVRIIYGGSVKPDNIAGLMNKSVIPDNDGALVGGASLKADSFIGIVKGVPAGPVNVAQERGVEARTAL